MGSCVGCVGRSCRRSTGLGGEFDVLENVEEGGRCFDRERELRLFFVGARGEGVAAMVKHALGEVGGDSVGLDAEVAEHGIRFPAAKELDGILVDASAQEGRGSAGAEAAGTQEDWVDTCFVVDKGGSVPEGVGDDCRLN